MVVAYLAAFGCALCYGIGSILQCVGARRLTASDCLDPRLLPRLARQLPYLAGLGLDLVGWLLSLIAVRTLPLFAVQATLASSVGVTAVVAAVFLGMRPGRRQLVALGALGLGVLLLAVTAKPGPPRAVGSAVSVGVALAVVPLVVGCALAARSLRGERAAVVLGALSGVAFGGAALCARALETDHTLAAVVTDPLSWALLGYGALGLTVFGASLQRGSVTLATAGQAAAETVVPAVAGVALLSDHARPGTAPLAVAGFVLAVAAASILAAISSPEAPADTAVFPSGAPSTDAHPAADARPAATHHPAAGSRRAAEARRPVAARRGA
jgi:drug/metabolite transporter (DMT)-like permease